MPRRSADAGSTSCGRCRRGQAAAAGAAVDTTIRGLAPGGPPTQHAQMPLAERYIPSVVVGARHHCSGTAQYSSIHHLIQCCTNLSSLIRRYYQGGVGGPGYGQPYGRVRPSHINGSTLRLSAETHACRYGLCGCVASWRSQVWTCLVAAGRGLRWGPARRWLCRRTGGRVSQSRQQWGTSDWSCCIGRHPGFVPCCRQPSVLLALMLQCPGATGMYRAQLQPAC